MVYITGDIHSDPTYVIYLARKYELTENDILVLLGDVGVNYYLNKRDLLTKKVMSEQIKATILCIHGNHEARPHTIEGYNLVSWHGGQVWVQPEFPNLLFAKDGSIFDLAGLSCLAIGGAYSVDKAVRLKRGYPWFADEQPSEAIKEYVVQQLASVDNKIDIIFSHTCPFKYEPREVFLSYVDQSTVDTRTEHWLDKIEECIDYKAWFCGHWHINKRIDKMHFLFDSWEALEYIK